MQTRLVLPLLALLAAVSVLLVVPALQGVSRQETSDLELSRRDAVDEVAAMTRSVIQGGDRDPLERYLRRYHELFGESVLVLDATESVVARVGTLEVADPRVQRRTRDFGYNVADLDVPLLLPWSSDTEVLSRPVDVGRDVASGTVILEVDQTSAVADVRRAWVLVLAAAAVAVVGLALLTRRAARWILRPVADLEDAALALAAQEPAPDVVASGPPELRRLARAFGQMASTLSATLAQQRDLVARTSHQLRNPLAAVRLQVDLLAGDDSTDRRRVEAAQDGLDRLDQTIDRLLGLAEAEHRVMTGRAARLADEHALDGEDAHASGAALVLHLADRWSDLPGLRTEGVGDVRAALPQAELDELVDTLVENAVKYAGDGATVRVRMSSVADGEVQVAVEDDGEGLDDAEITHAGERFWRSSRHVEQPGSGLGLAIVDAISRAAGGAMRVHRGSLGGLAVTVELPEVSA